LGKHACCEINEIAISIKSKLEKTKKIQNIKKIEEIETTLTMKIILNTRELLTFLSLFSKELVLAKSASAQNDDTTILLLICWMKLIELK